MRQRALLVNWLLVVAALGSLAGVLATRNSVTSAEISQRQQNLLRVFDDGAVTRIAVEGADQPFTMLRQTGVEGDEFEIVQPIEERAKAERVSSLMSSLGFAAFLRQVDEAKGAAGEFGLERPRWVLHVDHGDLHYRLRLGGKAAAPQDASYLEVTGENVPGKGIFVVRDGLVNELTLKLEDFRSHELAAIGQLSLSQVHWKDAKQQWLIKNDTARWQLVGSSGAVLADRERVTRFFEQLAHLKLETFLDVAAARAGLGQELTKLSLVPKQSGEKSVEIEIGGPCPDHPQWVIALRSQTKTTAGCIAKELVEGLRLSPEQLTERHLFSLRHDEVESFEVIRGDAKLVLTRSESGFRISAPANQDADSEAAQQMLKDWLDVEGEVDSSASAVSGAAGPKTSIVMHGVSDVPVAYREQRVELSAIAGKLGAVGLRSADNVQVLLPLLDLSQLDVSGLTLRSRTVLDLQARQLVRVEVTSRGVHQIVTQTESGPKLTEPQGFESDGLLLADFLDTLRGLRAVRWVLPGDRVNSPEPALTDAWLQVGFSVELSAANLQEHQLHVGASTQGGFFAQIDHDPVFVLSRRSAETLSTWLLDRVIFSPPLDSISELLIRSQAGQLRLERVGQRFQSKNVDPMGLQPHLSAAELEALLGELETLRPEAALHTGPPATGEGFAKPLLRVVGQQSNGAVGLAWSIGAADTFRNVPVYLARADGVDATYALARGPIDRILDAL